MGKIKILIGIIAAAVFLHFASSFYLSNSEQKKAAEDFVRMSPEIKSKIGDVKSLSLRRYVSVNASDTHGAYLLFDYMVRSDRSRANIVVRAVPQREQGKYLYSIDSLDRN